MKRIARQAIADNFGINFCATRFGVIIFFKNDDTRAFCSIPARHDVARRSDCAYLAELVGTGRLREAEAFEVAHDLTYSLAKSAYNL